MLIHLFYANDITSLTVNKKKEKNTYIHIYINHNTSIQVLWIIHA